MDSGSQANREDSVEMERISTELEIWVRGKMTELDHQTSLLAPEMIVQAAKEILAEMDRKAPIHEQLSRSGSFARVQDVVKSWKYLRIRLEDQIRLGYFKNEEAKLRSLMASMPHLASYEKIKKKIGQMRGHIRSFPMESRYFPDVKSFMKLTREWDQVKLRYRATLHPTTDSQLSLNSSTWDSSQSQGTAFGPSQDLEEAESSIPIADHHDELVDSLTNKSAFHEDCEQQRKVNAFTDAVEESPVSSLPSPKLNWSPEPHSDSEMMDVMASSQQDVCTNMGSKAGRKISQHDLIESIPSHKIPNSAGHLSYAPPQEDTIEFIDKNVGLYSNETAAETFSQPIIVDPKILSCTSSWCSPYDPTEYEDNVRRELLHYDEDMDYCVVMDSSQENKSKNIPANPETKNQTTLTRLYSVESSALRAIYKRNTSVFMTTLPGTVGSYNKQRDINVHRGVRVTATASAIGSAVGSQVDDSSLNPTSEDLNENGTSQHLRYPSIEWNEDDAAVNRHLHLLMEEEEAEAVVLGLSDYRDASRRLKRKQATDFKATSPVDASCSTIESQLSIISNISAAYSEEAGCSKPDFNDIRSKANRVVTVIEKGHKWLKGLTCSQKKRLKLHQNPTYISGIVHQQEFIDIPVTNREYYSHDANLIMNQYNRENIHLAPSKLAKQIMKDIRNDNIGRLDVIQNRTEDQIFRKLKNMRYHKIGSIRNNSKKKMIKPPNITTTILLIRAMIIKGDKENNYNTPIDDIIDYLRSTNEFYGDKTPQVVKTRLTQALHRFSCFVKKETSCTSWELHAELVDDLKDMTTDEETVIAVFKSFNNRMRHSDGAKARSNQAKLAASKRLILKKKRKRTSEIDHILKTVPDRQANFPLSNIYVSIELDAPCMPFCKVIKHIMETDQPIPFYVGQKSGTACSCAPFPVRMSPHHGVDPRFPTTQALINGRRIIQCYAEDTPATSHTKSVTNSKLLESYYLSYAKEAILNKTNGNFILTNEVINKIIFTEDPEYRRKLKRIKELSKTQGLFCTFLNCKGPKSLTHNKCKNEWSLHLKQSELGEVFLKNPNPCFPSK